MFVGLVNMAIVPLGVILADIRLANSNETILLGASVFNIGYVCYLKGQFDGYLNLIMCVTLQIVIPTPVAAAIEMRHYAVIFSMFLMCHTWIILKCYDYDKYMMVSSNLLLDLLDIYLLNQGFLDAV
ncbi:hypothetical protein CUMW_020450 [Citrus unshiu]|nr:hypothetical protein CUMW_020440 [Citrus unshiu]GAY36136.1 hypothetical protein CUMW_020450 [Citrus unshiu]